MIKKGKKVTVKKKITNEVSKKECNPEDLKRLNDFVDIANSHLFDEKNKNDHKIMANFSIKVYSDNDYEV